MHAPAPMADVSIAMFSGSTSASRLPLQGAHPMSPALLPNAVAVAYCCWLGDTTRLERATDLCLWISRHLRRTGRSGSWGTMHVPSLLADAPKPIESLFALELGMFVAWTGLCGLMPVARAREQVRLLQAHCPDARCVEELVGLLDESLRSRSAA